MKLCFVVSKRVCRTYLNKEHSFHFISLSWLPATTWPQGFVRARSRRHPWPARSPHLPRTQNSFFLVCAPPPPPPPLSLFSRSPPSELTMFPKALIASSAVFAPVNRLVAEGRFWFGINGSSVGRPRPAALARCPRIAASHLKPRRCQGRPQSFFVQGSLGPRSGVSSGHPSAELLYH